MSVTISPITIAGVGVPAPSSFSDSLIRASGSVGTGWVWGCFPHTPFVNNIVGANFAIGACLDAIQGGILTFQGVAPANTVWALRAVPPTIFQTVSGKNQFMQATYIGNAGVINNSSIQFLLACRMDEDTTYALDFNAVGAANQVNLVRKNQSAGTLLVGGFANLVANDVIRMSLNYNTPGTVAITVLKNGALLTSFNDVSGSRLLVGVPGMGADLGSGNHQFRNFSCGLGA